MRKLTASPVLDLSASQRRLAAELGVQDAQELSSRDLIAAIERHLGDDTALECARWYVMSVLRHESNSTWDDPNHSELSREQQYELARSCLAIPEFVQSIKTVLKGDTCKFVLVKFQRTRNTAKRILANTTVAYQCALAVLRDAHSPGLDANADTTGDNQAVNQDGLRTDVAIVVATDVKTVVTTDVATASLRRASRRGFASEMSGQGDNIPGVTSALPTTPTTDTAASSTLTPQEYAELEHALTQQPAHNSKPMAPRNFGDDESQSWLLGLLAGFVAFAVILFVFF